MGIFKAGQATQVKKTKSRRRRRSKTRQPKRPHVIRSFRDPGPAQGFKLEYDPKSRVFAHKWVLSRNGLVLQVTKEEPKELWEAMTQAHREMMAEQFEPVPQNKQEIRRRLDDEELRRINFWERVAEHGRKKHSHLDLGPPFSVVLATGEQFPGERRRKKDWA